MVLKYGLVALNYDVWGGLPVGMSVLVHLPLLLLGNGPSTWKDRLPITLR